ncbi:hypothetical protein L0222_09830 [bacterium]|nr:hypothetical protein [bacterium]MCI0604515.1 hypothetical protein [bacterium]
MNTWRLILLGVAILAFTSISSADIAPGARVGAFFDAESAFIGGEVVADLTENWSIVPNVEYVFLDNASQFNFNFDFQYNIRTDSRFEFWAGAGPAIIHVDPENVNRDSETDFGANLFAGVGFPLRDARILPYVQPKLILADNVEFALAFGVRF